jgi:hypothetical protein
MNIKRLRRLLLLLIITFSPASISLTNAAASTSEKTSPCQAKPEHRQFDFWVGEWDVLQAEKKIAESSIQEIIETCVIFENYNEMDGYTGKSVNFYDVHLGKWRQTWIDAQGMVSEFSGELKDEAMRFQGESHYPDGTKSLRRLTFFKIDSDRVRQYSEISRDDGKTWNPHYELFYVRKK